VISGGILLALGFSIVGWLVIAAIIYLVGIGVMSSLVENRRKATDRVIRGLVTVAFLIAMAPLVSTLYTVVLRGFGEINWNFISTTTKAAFDPKTLKVTTNIGAWQAIVGTLIITGIAALMSIPIGILTAIYLVEYSQKPTFMSRTVTFLVDVMTGIPSIVAGLFAFALFTLIVGPKAFSGFSASVALSVLMIPIVVRSIVLPTAISGLVTGVMLAIARVIGETAPIFIAASFTPNLNLNAFFGAMETLPVMAYSEYKFPSTDITGSFAAAWGAALLLIILVVILNLIARIVARVFSPKGLR
jgi:phosphate transport system permease protein